MAVTLVINNKSFDIPSPGDDPGWGEDTTGWIVEANKVIADIFGPGDILESTFSVANNVASPLEIVGLFFDSSTVRAATIEYSIYRISTANPSGNTESGIIQMVYDNSASPGNKWSFTVEAVNDAGVTFSISDVGQVSYVSTDINSVGYSGTMKFKASALAQ